MQHASAVRRDGHEGPSCGILPGRRFCRGVEPRLLFVVLDRAADDIGSANRYCVGWAGAGAVAAADALIAFDPDVGRVGGGG